MNNLVNENPLAYERLLIDCFESFCANPSVKSETIVFFNRKYGAVNINLKLKEFR